MTRWRARAPGSTARSCRRCGQAIAGGNCTSIRPVCSATASSPGARRRSASRRASRMDSATTAPVQLSGLAALRFGLQFVRDPLAAVRRSYESFGPFVVLADALPFIRHPRAVLFGVPLVLTAGAAFHRELLENPATWRPVSMMPGGPRHSAARRMTEGLMRMTGPRHAHYRKLLAAPLRRTSVDAMGEDMVRLAEEDIASWPVGETIDL